MFCQTLPPPSARLPCFPWQIPLAVNIVCWCVCWQNTVAVKCGRVDTNRQCQTGLTDERSTQQGNLTAAQIIWPMHQTQQHRTNQTFLTYLTNLTNKNNYMNANTIIYYRTFLFFCGQMGQFGQNTNKNRPCTVWPNTNCSGQTGQMTLDANGQKTFFRFLC